MNSENRKLSDLHKLLLSYTLKNKKESYKNNKFKVSVPL